jgi:Holliday junction resolvase-like predicted endonuclease
MSLKVEKGTRHTKIVGIFGEYVVCNWLSRSGFEASVVDHTGMDVIAYDPKTRRRLGITVKSRTRGSGSETASVNIFKNQDREKLTKACKTFGCDPWVAVYVECEKDAELYLISLARYDSRYKSKKKRVVDAWSMSQKSKQEYDLDLEVAYIHSTFKHERWPPRTGNRR